MNEHSITDRLTDFLHRLQPLPQEEGLEFDLIIVGAGPTGLSAAFFAERSRLNTLILEKAAVGGCLTECDIIEDYPGFPKGISGEELSRLLETQLEDLCLSITYEPAKQIYRESDLFIVQTEENAYLARSVLAATGTTHKMLKIKGEERLLGNGVSYDPSCDGTSYKGKQVAVIGSNARSLQSALTLAKLSHVTLVHEEDDLAAEEILIEHIENHPNITVTGPCDLEEIVGEHHVEGLRLIRLETSERVTLPVEAVFICAKQEPCSSLFKAYADCDPEGYLLTDENLMTKTPGLFAGGEVREKNFRSVLSDLADGAHTIQAIYSYLNDFE